MNLLNLLSTTEELIYFNLLCRQSNCHLYLFKCQTVTSAKCPRGQKLMSTGPTVDDGNDDDGDGDDDSDD